MRKTPRRMAWDELFEEVLRLKNENEELRRQAQWSATRAGAYGDALLRVGLDPRKIEQSEVV